MAQEKAPWEKKMEDKLQNFREAVEGNKKGAEVAYRHRILRQQNLSAVLNEGEVRGELAAVARNQYRAQERQGLMARCKMWNTNKFENISVLGQGAFGIVYLVRDVDDGKYYALKQMDKANCIKKNNRDAAFAELEVLAKNRCRWFVELHATFQDHENIYNVMEFLQGGDLIGRLILMGRLSENETRFYMAELLEALDAVHSAGYVHRDVKPDNMVFSADGHLKLLDFGLCRYCPLACAQARWTELAPGCTHLDVKMTDGSLIEQYDVDVAKVSLADLKVAVSVECGNINPKSVRIFHAERSNLPPTRAQMRELFEDGASLVALGLRAEGGPYDIIACSQKVRSHPRNLAGTPQYISPETWRHEETGPEGDIWAMAIITFECLVGHVPFHAGCIEGQEMIRIVRDKVVRHKTTFPVELKKGQGRGFISEAAAELLAGVIRDVPDRFSAERCRRTSFFHGLDFNALHDLDPPFVPDVNGPGDTKFFEPAHDCRLPEVNYRELRDPELQFAGYDADVSAIEANACVAVDVDDLLGSASRSRRTRRAA